MKECTGSEVGGRKERRWEAERTENGDQRSVLFTDKQNHDRDVTTTGAAMSRHDMLLPEILC